MSGGETERCILIVLMVSQPRERDDVMKPRPEAVLLYKSPEPNPRRGWGKCSKKK